MRQGDLKGTFAYSKLFSQLTTFVRLLSTKKKFVFPPSPMARSWAAICSRTVTHSTVRRRWNVAESPSTHRGASSRGRCTSFLTSVKSPTPAQMRWQNATTWWPSTKSWTAPCWPPPGWKGSYSGAPRKVSLPTSCASHRRCWLNLNSRARVASQSRWLREATPPFSS